MKKVLLFLGVFISILSVRAEENILQTIEIVPVKDTYNIVLMADKAVDIKKSVDAPNKITLKMKDITASKNLNTIYNNVSNVDYVMVEPDGNGINVFFQAENAENASVTFDSAVPVIVPTSEKQKITLSNPVESYAPIYHEDNAPKTSALFDRLKKTSQNEEFAGSFDSEEAPDTANKIFSFGLVGLLAFAVIRLFKNKEPEMKIGLSRNLDNQEFNYYKSQPIGSAYNMNTSKPFTTINYGINAYQKENKNPYDEEVTIHNPRLRNYVTPSVNHTVQTYPSAQPHPQSSVQTLQAVRKNTTPVNTAPVNQSNPNIDNLKFLESMTAIYEKSGRHDLARGLKASLSKNNIK